MVSNEVTWNFAYSLSSLNWQDKPAFIFCVEDRALFCQDCDEPIHSANSLSANHQRFLATGIRVALNSGCNKDTGKSCLEPPNSSTEQSANKMAGQHAPSFASTWSVDDLLPFSNFESSDKVGFFYLSFISAFLVREINIWMLCNRSSCK